MATSKVLTVEDGRHDLRLVDASLIAPEARPFAEELTVVFGGQNTFPLSAETLECLSSDAAKRTASLIIETGVYSYPEDWSVSGSNLIWGGEFIIEAGWQVKITRS